MGKIFISYRRDDSIQMTERIYEKLLEEYGSKSIFKDVDNIPAGADFRKIIEEQVQKCDIILAIIGKQWLTVVDEKGKQRIINKNDFVRIELDIGLKRGIPVIPILVDDASIPKEEDLPDSLNRLPYLNALQIRTHPDTENDMKRLIKAIDKSVFPYKNIIKYSKIVAVVSSLSFLGYSQYDNITNFFTSQIKEISQNSKYDWTYNYNDNGKKDGVAIAYYKGTKKIAIKGIYKDGKKDGNYTKYNKNGEKIEDGIYKNDEKIFQKTYFLNGNIKWVQSYKNGKVDGSFIAYSSFNSEKLVEVFYKDGKTTGEYILYDKDTGEIIDKDNNVYIEKYTWKFYPNEKIKYIYSLNKGGKKEGKYKEFYEDGKLKKVLIYKNGKLEGVAKGYYENGKIWWSQEFKNGEKDGKYKEFYEDGKLVKVLFYKNGKLEGKETHYYRGTTNKLIELFYKNGKLIEEYILYDKKTKEVIDKDKANAYQYSWDYYTNGKIKNFYANNKEGKKDGKYKRFYESGKLKTIWIYKNGKLEGIAKGYYENGKIWWSQEFKNGDKNGKYQKFNKDGKLIKITFYKNGEVEGKEIFYYKGTKNKLVEFSWKDGKLVGEYILYGKDNKIIDNDKVRGAFSYKWGFYSNSKIKYIYAKNKDNEKNGIYKEFYKNGNMKAIWHYQNGKLYGEFKQYYENGKLKKMGHYENGKLNGKYKKINEKGITTTVWNYKNGQIINKINYYSSGYKKYVYSYNNGKINGITKGYYNTEEGELASTWYYKNGKLDGEFKRYYKDGRLKQEGAYVNGVKKIYAEY